METRKRNWTAEETAMLVSLFEEHKDILKGKFFVILLLEIVLLMRYNKKYKYHLINMAWPEHMN